MVGTPRNNNERLQQVVAYAQNNPHSSFYQEVLRDIDVANLSKETLGTIRPTPIESMSRYSGSLIHIAESEARYLVSQFEDEQSNLFLLAQRTDHSWKTLEAHLRAHAPKGAVIAVSRNWQLGAPFYGACRAHNVPCTVFSPRDAQYVARLVEEVGIDMVVTTPLVAEEIASSLKDRNLEKAVKVWVLLAEFGAPATTSLLHGALVFEHHLFPGIPLGVSADGVHIEISREYFVEVASDGIYITSLEQHATPFIRLFVPGRPEVQKIGWKHTLSFTTLE